MGHLTLSLLGSARVELDGAPIEVDTRKAIALLAYLAVTAEAHSRDTLATLLWPENDQTSGRAALRRTLSSLKKALAGEWVLADRESIGLDRRDDAWVDVEQFRVQLAECASHGHPASDVCSACLPPLTKAAELYRGDFLTGFTLRDSPEFDDWQSLQAELLRRGLAGVLDRLVRGHSARAEFEQAILYARRWLALDPLHEPAQRTLMQLYAWAGNRAAAMRQYRDCVRILDEELGVAPLEETTQLNRAITENKAPPPAGIAVAAEPISQPPSREPMQRISGFPLVGRAREWEVLLGVYEAIATDGHFVVLEGEAGIGKTRLAEEFLAHARTSGATTIVARCYEGETTLAYGPFVEALRAAIAIPESAGRLGDTSARSLSEVARLLPELADLRPNLPAAAALDSPGAQSRFLDGVGEVLLACCGALPPGVLVVEDLHWADEASLDLFTYLVRRLPGRPLCIVATWRNEQLPAGHRLRRLLGAAQRAGNATLVTLPRLSRAAVEELVHSAAADGASLPEGLERRLYDETEGVPFFLVEYLTAIGQGAQLTKEGEWSLPGGARDLLRSRLAQVSEAGWQLLTAAAVIGRSFQFDVLRGSSGRSDEEAVGALEELIAQGLVEAVQGRDAEQALLYDFSHEKLRTLVYEETSLARRRLLHRRVADALARGAHGHRERGSVAGQIAHHYQLAGQDAKAAEYFKLAGEHARSLYANAEALSHFQSALALGHPLALALHEAIGDLRTLTGEYGAALASYETAAALCDAARLPGLEHKIGNLYDRRGEWELAERHFAAALEEFGKSDRDGERAKLYADWSLAAHRQGKTQHALDLARRGLKLAEAADDPSALAQAHNVLGILGGSQGDSEEARNHLRRSLALAENLGDVSARIAALNNLALAYGASGETKQALNLTEAALALCEAQGDRHREAALHNNLADLLHAIGRSEEAMAHLKQAVSIFSEIGVEAGAMQPEIWKLTEWAALDPAHLKTSVDAVASAVYVERPDLRSHAAPDGTVTIVFSDIDGSTAMIERLGDQRWLELLHSHNAIVREQVVSHGGFEVKSQGDGFMLAFQSARRALQCAVDIQRAFAKRNETADEPIRVRIGLHSGEVIREADDFFGKNVVLAARIANKARGSEILASSRLKELTESAGDITFGEGREVDLKGLSGLHQVFQVVY